MTETGLHDPDAETIAAMAAARGFDLDDDEIERYSELVADVLAGLSDVDDRSSRVFGTQQSTYPRRQPGYRPDDEEDPHNVWITRTLVEGARDGPLAGYEVGIKDCVALAGYELTAGSTLFEGFVPRIDATAVTRLLDAGATITGKVNMDSFANGGSGELSDFGPVQNPRDPTRLAGGSSSGSAAAVAAGECDIALGSDQGGSVRIPSAWCGVVGLKPTTGLVPYTGVVPVNVAFDTLGVHARTVEDVATALEVVAGEDRQNGVSLDPRQPRHVEPDAYRDGLDEPCADLSIGVVSEGFGLEASDPQVDEAVRDAVDVFRAEDVTVDTISVPLHEDAMTITMGMAIQGEAQLLDDDLVGTNRSGWFWQGLARVFGRFKRASGDELPVTLKATLLAADHLDETKGSDLYAKAKNMALELERQVTATLDEYDALVLPTVPFLPPEIDPELSVWKRVDRAHGMASNTATFSLTHHPALTVPCAQRDGVPVGMMLVAEQFDEATLLQLGHFFESVTDWTER